MRIVHPCGECGHEETEHTGRRAGYRAGNCKCCRTHNDPRPTFDLSGEPYVIDTFDAQTFQPEPLHRPGTTYNAGTSSRNDLCACPKCQDLARAVTS